MTDAHAALADDLEALARSLNGPIGARANETLRQAAAALRETLAENERLTRQSKLHDEDFERVASALAYANARIGAARAQLGRDECALHDVAYEYQLPDASRFMLGGATRLAERLSVPAVDAHLEPCEWCPEPHRGFAEWRGDSKAHRSCGAEGHGINFEPSRPQDNPEATRDALTLIARDVHLYDKGENAALSGRLARRIADAILAEFNVTPKTGGDGAVESSITNHEIRGTDA